MNKYLASLSTVSLTKVTLTGFSSHYTITSLYIILVCSWQFEYVAPNKHTTSMQPTQQFLCLWILQLTGCILASDKQNPLKIMHKPQLERPFIINYLFALQKCQNTNYSTASLILKLTINTYSGLKLHQSIIVFKIKEFLNQLNVKLLMLILIFPSF